MALVNGSDGVMSGFSKANKDVSGGGGGGGERYPVVQFDGRLRWGIEAPAAPS
jgi:hypothetical protein